MFYANKGTLSLAIKCLCLLGHDTSINFLLNEQRACSCVYSNAIFISNHEAKNKDDDDDETSWLVEMHLLACSGSIRKRKQEK